GCFAKPLRGLMKSPILPCRNAGWRATMEDELDKLKPAGLGPEMERWNVEDLEAYIAAMREEIARVEAIIADKGSVNAAAAALFGDTS
ncbi:MAG: DUF1192 domain-containing protein, partial [Pseudomonadota bacterium]|nr:DUF1192 domain-containing protein [Pseudomonadota bacterium]